MKNIISVTLGIVALLWLFPLTVHADMGPKPSVVVDFQGFEGQRYYATLLSETPSTGPYSAPDPNRPEDAHMQPHEEGYDIFLKFVGYRDPDGFYFLQFFEDCSQTQRFSWTYYPPQTFKILLYFPETDRFLISEEPYGRYAFDSCFTAGVAASATAAQGDGGMTVTRSYAYADELLSLLIRILLTFAVELAIAWIFGFRSRGDLRFIALVNAATQILLNLALGLIGYRLGPMAFVFFYILLEIAVFVIEGTLYTRYLSRPDRTVNPRRIPWIYALTANAASFALGMALARWIPGIF